VLIVHSKIEEGLTKERKAFLKTNLIPAILDLAGCSPERVLAVIRKVSQFDFGGGARIWAAKQGRQQLRLQAGSGSL